MCYGHHQARSSALKTKPHGRISEPPTPLLWRRPDRGHQSPGRPAQRKARMQLHSSTGRRWTALGVGGAVVAGVGGAPPRAGATPTSTASRRSTTTSPPPTSTLKIANDRTSAKE